MARLFDYDRATALMRHEGIDLLLVARRQNVAYLSGITSIIHWEYPDVPHILEMQEDGCPRADYFVGLPANSAISPFAVTHRPYEFRKGWIQDVRSWCLRRHSPAVERIAAAIEDRGLGGAVLGVEMDYLPAGRLAELRARLPRVRFQPADALMWRLRAVKTDEEIRRQRRAFAAASAIYRRVAQDVKPGMTVNEVRALEMSLVVAAGCAPLIFGYVTPTYNSRGMPAPKTGAGQTAGDAVLRAGDVILCDLGLVYQGYTTDFGRMLTLGAPDSRTRNAYAAILAIRQTLEASVKPGRTAGEVYAAGLRTAVECGLAADGIPYFGHSIGLECHEAPSIVKDDPTVIEKGMTLVLEVCPVVDGIWFLLENTGVVTDRGWESLTDLPTDFLVAE